jgi:hypothetical protein
MHLQFPIQQTKDSTSSSPKKGTTKKVHILGKEGGQSRGKIWLQLPNSTWNKRRRGGELDSGGNVGGARNSRGAVVKGEREEKGRCIGYSARKEEERGRD